MSLQDREKSLLLLGNKIEEKLLGLSERMSEVFELINKISQTEMTVLIRGESGTGKEWVARAIHQNSSYKHGKFIPVNCAAIPSHLVERELFGHEEETFTGATERKIGLFQLADRGVLFLDEIGAFHMDLQAKFLHALGNKKFLPIGGHSEIRFNTRIIAATNRNLEKMVEKKIFREDLFFHLNILPIFMPPLRERTDDLEGLIEYILNKNNYLHKVKSIQPDALEILKSYRWPGNIRELENVIEKAILIEGSDSITLESIPEDIQLQALGHVQIDITNGYKGPLDFDVFKTETEKGFIVNALKASHGRINKAVVQANIPKIHYCVKSRNIISTSNGIYNVLNVKLTGM